MTNSAAVDNDVLIKLACYRLLCDVLAVFGGSGSVGILGAARFVVTNNIRRSSGINDQESALQDFAAFLAEAEELEPADDEIDLATELEEAASQLGAGLDFGESQLCAIVLLRKIPMLVTGDKRAIVAAEILKSEVGNLAELEGKFVCLEQLVLGLTDRIGHAASREKICAEPNVDKALSICFACWSDTHGADSSVADGLRSYIGDIRSTAWTLLYPQDAVPVNFAGKRRTAPPTPPQA